MVQKEFVITNAGGLHTRPGNDFVKTTKQFACEISLTKDGKTVDAKSLLKIMKANIVTGDAVIIRCNGADEEDALRGIESYLAALKE